MKPSGRSQWVWGGFGRLAPAGVFFVCIALGDPVAVGAQAVVGQVLDGENGRPIAGASLLLGDRAFTSDERGRFFVDGLAPGPAWLVTQMLGYAARTDSLAVPPEDLLRVVIPMARDPIELEPVAVTIRSRILEMRGFYERQEGGFSGHMFTRRDITDRDPRNMTELIGMLPGVRILQAGIEGPRVVFDRAISLAGRPVCEPSLFLDGVKSQIRIYDLILDPEHLEGVEVYTGAGVPGRYNDPCGAILVWTRVPHR